MHNIGRIFCLGKGSGKAGASGSAKQPGSKKRHSKVDNLRAAMSRDYERVSNHKVLPTKWVDREFLSRQGLLKDFEQMTVQASMVDFSYLSINTYKLTMFEFLSSFHDDLETQERNCTVNFVVIGQLHNLTFYEFCNSFGFSHEGELDINDNVHVEAMQSWGEISIHRDNDYLCRKSATIQNPTIHYFHTFLLNFLLGKVDVGEMPGPKMSVIHMALHPDMVRKVNLGAFLIQHFCRQRSASAGNIRCGGLIT